MSLCRYGGRILRAPIPSRQAQDLSRREWLEDAIIAAEILQQQQGISLPRDIAYKMVCECTKKRDLELGRRIQLLMTYSGFDSVAFFADHLIRLFASCGALDEADEAFAKVIKPSIYTWNSIIDAHARLGKGVKALHLFNNLQSSGEKPNRFTFPSLLKACASIGDSDRGAHIHAQILEHGLQSDLVVASSLVDMYAKCGNLEDANIIFNNMPYRNIVSWGVMVGGYAQYGNGHLALECFDSMLHEELKPDRVVFLSILKACTSIQAVEHGRWIRERILECGCQSDIPVSNTLIDMYAKCARFEEAHGVLRSLPKRNVVSWGALIAGYAQHGENDLVFEWFDKMIQDGIRPNEVIFLSVLKACSNMRIIVQTRYLHEQIIEDGYHLDSIISNATAECYAKSGSLLEAYAILNASSHQSLMSWSVIIAESVQKGEHRLALDYFNEMQCRGINPERTILLSILKACGNAGDRLQGRCIHEQIINDGFQDDTVLGNTLVDMYAKCGSLEEACMVFDKLLDGELVAVNAMIAGYAQHGEAHFALEWLEDLQRAGLRADRITYLAILKACSSITNIELGRTIHEQILENVPQFDAIMASALVDMYAKCGSLLEARCIFDCLPCPDVVSWGAIISGYANNGEGCLALECFEHMQAGNIKPNKVIFLSLLKACSCTGAIAQGRHVQKQIDENGLLYDVAIGCTVVDMYAKCGSLNEARKVFNSLPNQDEGTWGAMIAGYAQLGEAGLALQCFEDMQHSGIGPNSVAFSGVLASFSRTGMVDEAHLYYKSLIQGYGLTKKYHLICMVDLLGRAGHLNAAENLLNDTMEHDFNLWVTLLNACQIHCNIEMGEICFNAITSLNPLYAPAYVLMSNIYAQVGMAIRLTSQNEGQSNNPLRIV